MKTIGRASTFLTGIAVLGCLALTACQPEPKAQGGADVGAVMREYKAQHASIADDEIGTIIANSPEARTIETGTIKPSSPEVIGQEREHECEAEALGCHAGNAWSDFYTWLEG